MDTPAKPPDAIPLTPSNYWRAVYLAQQAENRCDRMDPSGAKQLVHEILVILLTAGGQRA